MLVEINLLPQKEPKKIGFIITLSSILVVMILIGAYYLWQINVTKSEVASLERQIAMTKRITEKEEQNSQSATSTNSVGQLKEAIDWANEYPIQTIPVMRKLTSLLPERGFIQSFGYTEAGTITLSVQFDSAREAAYFLENLNESKWIEDVSLSSLSAAAPPAETATTSSTTAGSTTQTNTADAPASTTNQTNTTNPNQSTTGQNSTDATVNTGNQMNSATGTTVSQGNTENTTTNTNSANNTSATTTTSSTQVKKENTNILPRYTGQFEIKLNKVYVKENIKKSKKDEKGVTGS